MRSPLFFVVITLLMLFLGGCGQQGAPTVETVEAATIKPGDAIPAPTGEVILTISGDISQSNVGDTLVLDLATVEQMGLVSHTVKNDPFTHSEVTYTGVLLSDLLKVAGASDAASTVHMTALDGYEVDIPIAETQRWPVLVATRLNGEHMAVENNGPTWLIFPYDSIPAEDKTIYDDLSIWNLVTMEIR